MQGVEVNAVDSQKRTPLLLAASKGAWKTVHLLLESGADISLKDNKNRNFLHLAIKYGGKLNQFGVQSIKVFILTLKLSIVVLKLYSMSSKSVFLHAELRLFGNL